MADTVLESFLIKLGYQIDQSSQKQFVNSIHDGLKSVTEFATAIVGMAVAVEEAVRRTSAQMARLTFASTMGGTTVQRMREIGYAAEAVGGSYEGAIAAQENLNQKLTEAPWLKSWFKAQLHGHSEDIGGIIDRYIELASTIKGEEEPAAVQFALMMKDQGLITQQMLSQGYRLREERAQVVEHSRTVSALFASQMKTAEANSIKLATSWTNLGFTVDTMWKSVTGGLAGILSNIFDKFDQWLQANAPAINKFMAELEPLVKQISDEVLAWIDDLIKNPKKIEDAWKEVKATFITVKDAVIALGHAAKWCWEQLKAIDQWFKDMGADPALAAALTGAAVILGTMFAKAFVGAVVSGTVSLPGKLLGMLTGAGGAGAGAGAGAGVGAGLGAAGGVIAGGAAAGAAVQHITGKEVPWWQIGLLALGGGPGGMLAAGGEALSRYFGLGLPKKNYQHGGIVPINAHPGEMVLPQNISTGLQSFFSGDSSWDESLGDLGHWLGGDTTFAPLMQFADQAYDKLVDVFEESLRRVWPNADQAGPGGGAGGGAGGGSSKEGEGPPGGPTPAAGLLSQQALEAIAKGEGTFIKGQIDYNQIYGNKHADLGNMTLEQVMRMQQGMGEHTPVGAFQITRATLGDLIKSLKLDPSMTKMTPEVQQQLASELYRQRGFNMTWVNPETRAGRTQAEFERLRQAGQLYSTGGGALPPGDQTLVKQLQSGVRNKPLAEELTKQLAYAAKQVGVIAEVVSGGQPESGPNRVGSHRHDLGRSADLKLRDPKTGLILSMNNPEDRARMEQFVRESVHAGATGVGAGVGYMGPETMHIGGGTPATWGGASWIRSAWEKGRELARTAPIRAQQMEETVKKDNQTGQRAAANTNEKPQQVVDNSVHNVNIHGVTNPHGVPAALERLGDRNTAYGQRNGRTMVT
jgi:hypothetical protein